MFRIEDEYKVNIRGGSGSCSTISGMYYMKSPSLFLKTLINLWNLDIRIWVSHCERAGKIWHLQQTGDNLSQWQKSDYKDHENGSPLLSFTVSEAASWAWPSSTLTHVDDEEYINRRLHWTLMVVGALRLISDKPARRPSANVSSPSSFLWMWWWCWWCGCGDGGVKDPTPDDTYTEVARQERSAARILE